MSREESGKPRGGTVAEFERRAARPLQQGRGRDRGQGGPGRGHLAGRLRKDSWQPEIRRGAVPGMEVEDGGFRRVDAGGLGNPLRRNAARRVVGQVESAGRLTHLALWRIWLCALMTYRLYSDRP
jgi:hypothetical protein